MDPAFMVSSLNVGEPKRPGGFQIATSDVRGPKKPSPLNRFPTWNRALVWLVVPLILQSLGCASLTGLNSALPAPPPHLDLDAMEEVRYQSPDGPPRNDRVVSLNRLSFDEDRNSAQPASPVTGNASDRVAAIKVVGNRSLTEHEILRNLHTRPGRFLDPDRLQQDVSRLWRMPEIRRVNGPFLERTEKGVIVTLEVEERKLITQVDFIGNRGIADRTLKKESGLEDGQPLNVHQIRMAKTRLEEYYKEKGYPRTQIEIMNEGQTDDTKVVFLIHEDEQQRVWKVTFEGNTIASDARLRHFVKSKPGILKVFGGLVNRDEIDQDITRLTSYYRSLGFFDARIGREVSESNDGRWLNVRYIINEGPRYKVRQVVFQGNQVYSSEQLASMVELKPGADGSPEFNSSKMKRDVGALRDLYGSEGFVFSNVEAQPLFLEEPGQLDIVYKINEGKQYVVGNIRVHYVGGGGITKREAIINRIGVRTGELINISEVRNSERRLGASQLFAVGGQSGGPPPRIVVRPPELRDLEQMAEASRGSSFR